MVCMGQNADASPQRSTVWGASRELTPARDLVLGRKISQGVPSWTPRATLNRVQARSNPGQGLGAIQPLDQSLIGFCIQHHDSALPFRVRTRRHSRPPITSTPLRYRQRPPFFCVRFQPGSKRSLQRCSLYRPLGCCLGCAIEARPAQPGLPFWHSTPLPREFDR